jgi:hypothetical protein
VKRKPTGALKVIALKRRALGRGGLITGKALCVAFHLTAEIWFCIDTLTRLPISHLNKHGHPLAAVEPAVASKLPFSIDP